MVGKEQEHSQFWRHVGFAFEQLDGLIEGYQVRAPKAEQLSRLALVVSHS